jgi:hypothetical protein
MCKLCTKQTNIGKLEDLFRECVKGDLTLENLLDKFVDNKNIFYVDIFSPAYKYNLIKEDTYYRFKCVTNGSFYGGHLADKMHYSDIKKIEFIKTP